MEISRRQFLGGVATSLACVPPAFAATDKGFDPTVADECRPRQGLPNALAKLVSGETVRIAYLGGVTVWRGDGGVM